MQTTLLCVILVFGCFAEDPCFSPRSFTDREKRAPTFELGNGDIPLSDRYIQEGWYGDLGVEMSDKAPDQRHCGTVYPVYLKASVPNSDKEETVDVCIYSDQPCGDTFKTKVKRCEFFIVYYLKRLPLSSAAYCIGSTGKKGEYPEYKPEVNIKVNMIHSNELVFDCDFQKSSDQTLWYTVLWYVDGRLITICKPVKEPLDEKTRLEEETLLAKGINTVGFHVSCAVGGSFQKNSPLSLPSKSKEEFIGFKILTPIINLVYGDTENAKIEIQSTAPIGCSTIDPDCKLDVNVIYPAATDAPCDPHAVFEHTDCKVRVGAISWTKVYEMKIRLSNDQPQYNGNKVFIRHLRLQTANRFVPHQIWGNYTIGDVQVHLTANTRSIESKTCYAVCDPHMHTFEATKYEHQLPGVFTLYENKKWKQEVQFQTAPCYNERAYCICGLAVRAGREVFKMDHCAIKFWYIAFELCEEEKPLLGVKRLGKSKYKILFPSGTTLQIDIMSSPYVGFINVYMTPSKMDVGNSRGLCGNVNHENNENLSELYHRDGKLDVDINDGGFSRSWKVAGGNVPDLFQPGDLEKIDGSDYIRYFCNCKASEGGNILTCDNTECKTIPEYTSSPPCLIRNSRKKRSVSKYLFNVRHLPLNDNHRVERSASDTWRNGWTEEKARAYCISLFKNSSAVQICKAIPTVDLEGPMNNCVLDIEYTGDTGFSLVAVETVKNKCYQEVNANATLREEPAPGKPSIFDQVKEVACPLECSHQGDCVKGICKCNENYGGIDCSVDIRDPPLMVHLSEDGYCDLSDDECSEVSVFGGVFVETENSSCKINSIQMNDNGTNQDGDEMIQPTDVESLGEAICTLPKTRTRRTAAAKPEMEFVKVYKISVANDGIAYSNESLMVIFNSRCQYCTIHGLNVTCLFTGDFCMSGGVCYDNGEPHGSHECYVCSATNNSRSWVYSKDPRCPIEQKEVEQSEQAAGPLWIIGAVLGIVALASIAMITLWFTTAMSKRKIAPSSYGSKTVLTGPPPYSTRAD